MSSTKGTLGFYIFVLDFLRTRQSLSIQLSPLDGLTHQTSDNQLAQDHTAGDGSEEGS